MPRNIFKTVAQIIMFWTFFLWFVPQIIVRIEDRFGFPGFRPMPLVGWTLFISMGFIGIASGMIFAVRGGGTPLPLDTTTRFLVLGPYRYVRNPMAITGTMQGVSVGLSQGSFLVVGYSVAGMFAWHWIARPWEEEDLEKRFGESYRRYRHAVRCWFPRLKPYEAVCQGAVEAAVLADHDSRQQ